MQVGIVQSFEKRRGQRYGELLPLGSDKRVFFHAEEGRSFQLGSCEPLFQSSEPLAYHPKKGDLVVYERRQTDRGPRASPWGLYGSYRATYAQLLRDCLPPQAVEFPCLMDVLIAGKRIFTPGPFALRTQPLTPAVMHMVPLDDLVAFKASYFYAVVRREDDQWIAIELKCKYVTTSSGKNARFNAPSVSLQLAALGLKLRQHEVTLVRLDVDERVGLVRKEGNIPPNIAVEQRQLTVYL